MEPASRLAQPNARRGREVKVFLNPFLERPLLCRTSRLYTLYRLAVSLLLYSQQPFPPGIPARAVTAAYLAITLAVALLQLFRREFPHLFTVVFLGSDFGLLILLADSGFYELLLSFFALHVGLLLHPLAGLGGLAVLGGRDLVVEGASFRTLLTGGASLALFLLMHFLTRQLAKSQHAAQEALTTLSQIFPLIAKHSRQGIVVVRGEEVLFVNPQARKFLGLPAAPFRRDELPKEVIDFLQQRDQEEGFLQAKNPSLHLTKHLFKGTAVLLLEDETYYRKRLLEAQLATLGRISSAIAHEIRNPLGTILQASQLLREQLGGEDRASKLIQLIERGCRRIDQIVHNIYQLHASSPPQHELVALNDFLKRLIEELLEFFPQFQKVQLRLLLPQTPVSTRVDPSHLRQILLNLCQNALEHGLNPKRPVVELRLRQAGKRAVIEVVDFGKGIPESLREQIFEPFVTTSPKGKGLGLYLVRELASRNGLAVEYVPNPEGGSIFRLKLKIT